MSRLKLFISFIIGFSVYILMTVTVGRNGIWAYHQLESQKILLTENVASLQSVNENLNLDYLSLQSDEARIKALARKLGYVNDGEVLVRINGISEREMKVYDCGSVYRVQEILFVEERTCKGMGIMFSLLSGVLLFVTGLKKERTAADAVTSTQPVQVGNEL